MIRKLRAGGYRLYSRKVDPRTGRVYVASGSDNQLIVIEEMLGPAGDDDAGIAVRRRQQRVEVSGGPPVAHTDRQLIIAIEHQHDLAIVQHPVEGL